MTTLLSKCIRVAGALIGGYVAWGICATVLDILLRFIMPGYLAAEPTLQFTPGMMAARLALPGAMPSVAAGYLCAWIARGDRRVVVALGVVLLVSFLPAHYRLWSSFPAWYHLTFLASLVMLTLLGAKLRGRGDELPSPTTESPGAAPTIEPR